MQRALSYTVEYLPRSFSQNHESAMVMNAIKYTQHMPSHMEPAIGFTFLDDTASHGVVTSLMLRVIVPDSGDALANVLTTLDKFEERIGGDAIKRQYRTVDGKPAP